MKNVTLVLSDGTKFHGKSFGYDAPVAGEVVFNTAMMGYPESLTDPSYAGQLMTLTYPLVGNYGVPPFTIESNGIPTFMESMLRLLSLMIIVSSIVIGMLLRVLLIGLNVNMFQALRVSTQGNLQRFSVNMV